jgi:hypothetical protein
MLVERPKGELGSIKDPIPLSPPSRISTTFRPSPTTAKLSSGRSHPTTMEHQTPTERAKALVSALEEHGQGDYIGESINQLEHSLQAADQARKSGKHSFEFLLSAQYLITRHRSSR